jgi:ligand-binding sensor domain-containing protein
LRGGLTFASTDLQRWRWIDGTISVPMVGMRATSMSVRAARAWIGTDRGVVRARLDGTEEMAVWTLLDGLPDDRVFAVSARSDGAWVGTARGLVFISDTSDTRSPRTRGIGTRLLDNTRCTRSSPSVIPLWIGTASVCRAAAEWRTLASTGKRPGAAPSRHCARLERQRAAGGRR